MTETRLARILCNLSASTELRLAWLRLESLLGGT